MENTSAILGDFIGGVTLTGSLIAFGKLNGNLSRGLSSGSGWSGGLGQSLNFLTVLDRTNRRWREMIAS